MRDVYRLKIGIRSVKWSDTSFLINDKPFYFAGFGRHEDFFVSLIDPYLKQKVNSSYYALKSV